MNTEKVTIHFEEMIKPNVKFYLEDSCRAILCGCYSCQMRARNNYLKWGIPIPTKKEAREILGLAEKAPIKLKVYQQIEEILQKKGGHL
ncbi:hypothetical protein HYW44_02865 [Candidatus Daviesbacteria bacterium]|nr:hypothetical protein [Candidatus Daviesbacteria bacterium]